MGEFSDKLAEKIGRIAGGEYLYKKIRNHVAELFDEYEKKFREKINGQWVSDALKRKVMIIRLDEDMVYCVLFHKDFGILYGETWEACGWVGADRLFEEHGKKEGDILVLRGKEIRGAVLNWLLEGCVLKENIAGNYAKLEKI